MKEFIFSFTITFLISNLTYLLFEMPLTNVLLKLFNLNRRRDITVETKQVIETETKQVIKAETKQVIKYDYSEINNNNPDFKLIKSD